MRQIGLLSDTHGYLDDKIISHLEPCDEIWHAGDIGTVEVYDQLAAIKPVRAVYGNIDGQSIRVICPKHQRFTCEGVKVWITHIGGYPKKYSLEIRDEIVKTPPDLFISGHSHILKVMPDPQLKLLHINPGAVGKQGFQKVRTMVRFAIDGSEIKNLEVIELFPRR